MRIMGIDPGSRICGWGIIEETKTAKSLTHVNCGFIAPKVSLSLPDRLKIIYDGLKQVLETYQPDHVAIESVFYAKNAKSALILGHARGVAILAAVQSDLPIHEYSPANIKQAVCGYGQARKEQVGRMVTAILCLPEPPQTDAADALACAICHSNSYKMKVALQNQSR